MNEGEGENPLSLDQEEIDVLKQNTVEFIEQPDKYDISSNKSKKKILEEDLEKIRAKSKYSEEELALAKASLLAKNESVDNKED